MPTLGLSMIAKNEASTIAPCIESVRNFVSQVVVADTGSTDDTIDIARRLGATVISIPWADHFADARNAALRLMKTDWVLSLDADEELDANGASGLRRLMSHRNIAGYVLPIRNYTPARETRAGMAVAQANDGSHARAASAGSYFTYTKCRLFRNQSNIRFTGRIHEQVEVTIRAAKLRMEPAGICIHNFGLLSSRCNMAEKLTYYRKLLQLRVKEEPHDFRGWTFLGRMEYDSFNNRTDALLCFQRALELNPLCVEARLFTAMIYLDLGRGKDALPFLSFQPPDRESSLQRYRLLGDALSQSGHPTEACAAYRDVLKLAGDDLEVTSKLGLLEVTLGVRAEGLAKLETAAQASPSTPHIQDRLMKGYLISTMLPQAAKVAEILTLLVPRPKSFLRAASIYAQYQNWADSSRILNQGLALFPNAPELAAARAQSVASASH